VSSNFDERGVVPKKNLRRKATFEQERRLAFTQGCLSSRRVREWKWKNDVRNQESDGGRWEIQFISLSPWML
jgi:hypothetical protein